MTRDTATTPLCLPHELETKVVVPLPHMAVRIMNPFTSPLPPMSRMALMGSGRWVGTMPGSIKTACVLCVLVCFLNF